MELGNGSRWRFGGRPDLFVGGRDQVLIQQGSFAARSLGGKYRGTCDPQIKTHVNQFWGRRVLGKGHPPPPTSRVFERGGAFPLRESQHKPHHNISQSGNFWGFGPRTRSHGRGGLRDFPFPRGPGYCDATRFMMELPSHRGTQ